MLETAVLTVLPGAVAFAAAMDLFTMKIPNRISVLLVLAFFPLALLAGLDGWVIADHVSAGVLMLVLGVLLFIPGWFGGGDAKLMAAIGLWIGPENLLAYMLYVNELPTGDAPLKADVTELTDITYSNVKPTK